MNIQEYANHAVASGAKCWDCKRVPDASEICHYDHPEGWVVDGFTQQQWLYFDCPECLYQTSFAKLGVARPEKETWKPTPHPEAAEDEIFLINVHRENTQVVGWKTKRVGQVAFDESGEVVNPAESMVPIFVKVSEAHARGITW